MTRKHPHPLLFAGFIFALAGVTPASDAALFGFTPLNDALWEQLVRSFMTTISPVDIMMIAMLAHARRSSSIH